MSPSDSLRVEFALACPSCRQADVLHIAITCTAELTANGSKAFGDHDWDDGSTCHCPKCNHTGVVGDFRIDRASSKHTATTNQGDRA